MKGKLWVESCSDTQQMETGGEDPPSLNGSSWFLRPSNDAVSFVPLWDLGHGGRALSALPMLVLHRASQSNLPATMIKPLSLKS